LQPLVYGMIQAAVDAGKYEYAVGIALEAREIQQLESILGAAAGSAATTSILKYAITTVQTV